MTDDLRPLRLLLAEVERQRDQALAEQLQAEAARRAGAAKAEDLIVYRRDYERRWSDQFCREGRIELVRCYQGFMERLSQAVEQQVAIAAQAEICAEQAVQTVRSHELRAAGVRKLIERRLVQARLGADRLEQKQSDERAARAAWAQLDVSGFSAAA